MIIRNFLDENEVRQNFYIFGTLYVADKYIDSQLQATGAILMTFNDSYYIMTRMNTEYGSQANGNIFEFVSKNDLINFITYNSYYFPNVDISEIVDLLS